MSTRLTSCPDCGASNAPSVQWCGQCYAPFTDGAPASHGDATSPTGGAVDPFSAESSQPAPEPVAAPPRKGLWTCRLCETHNEVEASECSSCGTAIFDAIAPSQRSAPEPLTASAYAFPGLALTRADRSIEGAIVMLLGIAGLLTMVLIPSWPVRVLLLLFVAAIWVLGIRDATSRDPLLTVPVLRWVMVAYGVSIIALLLAVSAIGSPSG